MINLERPLGEVSRERLRSAVVQGVPVDQRGEIWCLLCNCDEEIKLHSGGLYQKLLAMEDPQEEYRISKDLRRTLPDLRLFFDDYKTGQNRLYNILKAYASFDSELGYA